LGLTEDARAIEEYTGQIKDELKRKRAMKVFSLRDLRLYECPLSYLSVETMEVIRLVYLVDSTGGMFFAGGLGAQPAWLIEAYELYKIERLKSEKDSA